MNVIWRGASVGNALTASLFNLLICNGTPPPPLQIHPNNNKILSFHIL